MIPSNMNYRDCERVYVKKEISLDEWKKSLTKENKNVIIDTDSRQDYRRVERVGESVKMLRHDHVLTFRNLKDMPMDMYLSEKANLKPKEAHTIHTTLKKVAKMINAHKNAELPKVYIVSPSEANGAIASYRAFDNKLSLHREYLSNRMIQITTREIKRMRVTAI